MTATKSVTPRRKRSHHQIDSSKESQAALGRFSTRVRERRLKLGKSQREIADKVGISVNQYSNIECGVNWVGMPVYRRLSKALGVALPRLLK
jgi:ribosome-binding protein aMBF1 (putative translation factor)